MSTTSKPTRRGVGDGRWAALIVASTAQLVVAVDATVVTIALPATQASLGFSDADRAWVLSAYTVAYGGLLLLGGRVTDRIGQRRALLAGLLGFAAASAVAGTASTFAQLVAGRAGQGACAALMTPAALAAIAVTFPQPRERGRAFGVYGAVASSGGVLGLLVGGLLTAGVGWRWCLLVNVAVCAAAIAAGRAVLPDTGPERQVRVDVLSAMLATGAMGAVVLGIAQVGHRGPLAPLVLGPMLVTVVLGGVFLRRQRRLTSPLLPLGLLRDPIHLASYVAAAAAVLSMFGTFLVLTFYFQRVLEYSPSQTGVAFVPMTLAVAVSSSGVAGRLLHRTTAMNVMAPGLVTSAAGLALLTDLEPTDSYTGTLLPAMVLIGLGIGCVVTPAMSAATSNVAPHHAGAAAATINIAMQAGASIGAAALNALVVHTAESGRGPTAMVAGYATAAGASATLLLSVALAVIVLARIPLHRERHQHAHEGGIHGRH